MKKVLIITYYWPPSGGSGVQRWLKFVKYFSEFGIEPVVYTVPDNNYSILDDTLENEIPEGVKVIRGPIWEPNSLIPGKGKKRNEQVGFLKSNPGFLGKLLYYIRANFFIPDARKFWIRPSVKYLNSFLQNEGIDTIISTGPPHSTHIIARRLKQLNPDLKWIADFRDPWTKIDYFHQLPLTKRSKEKHFLLEGAVLKEADRVVVVGKTMKSEYKSYTDEIYTISNGFDNPMGSNENPLDDHFTLVHIGLMNEARSHGIFWQVLQELVEENTLFKQNFKLRLIGKIAPKVLADIKRANLQSHVEIIDYIPHKKVSKVQASAQLLLIMVNDVPAAKGIVTGKVFEYLASGRPILAMGPVDGDLATILSETESGVVINIHDHKGLKNSISNYFDLYIEGKLKSNRNTDKIMKYHRRALTKKYAELILGMYS